MQHEPEDVMVSNFSLAAFCLLLVMATSSLQAQDHRHAGVASPYAGFETRAIKSLSEADIEALRQGAGWGLALAAEWNGAPGPAHLLELKDEIGLSAEQVDQVEAIYAEMKSEAIAAGEKLINAEQAIENAFAAAQLDEERLRSLIDQSEAARADLRFIHLSRHLRTPPLLTDQQIALYNALRGYVSAPCGRNPDGHDERMWRRHQGCD